MTKRMCNLFVTKHIRFVLWLSVTFECNVIAKGFRTIFTCCSREYTSCIGSLMFPATPFG